MGHRFGHHRQPRGAALTRTFAALLCCAAALAAPAAASAQSTLRAQCGPAFNAAVRELCENVADATVILQPRIGVALSGGNPVPGTASTMGMRFGSMPRISLGLRVTAAAVELPPVERLGQQQNITFPVGGISVDGSVGVFQGIALLPTVGGFGSLDLLASAGVLPLPRGEGFDDGSALSWAAGVRLGVLRESFTAPGVSIDLMYRRLGDVAYGSPDLTDRDAFLSMTDSDVRSARLVVGKRILGFGATAGAGYDRYRSSFTGRVGDPRPGNPDFILEVADPRVITTRTSLFGNASLTVIILNLNLEAGWQQGGSPPTGATDLIGKGGLFGGIAVRLAI